MRARRATLIFLALLTTGLVAGCSSGSSGGSASGSSARSAVGSGGAVNDQAAAVAGGAAEIPRSADTSGGAGSTSSTSGAGTDVARALDQQIRTGRLTLQVSDMTYTLSVIRSDATVYGGYVSDENSDFGGSSGPGGSVITPEAPPGGDKSVITLRVPNDRLDEAMAAITRTGRQLDRGTSVQDVTGSLADLGSREKTERDSLNRVRALMQQATNLHDVVLLEGELSSRESDLESIEAQQRALAGQANLSTLTVTLLTSAPPAVAKPAHHDGFTGGLRHGWHAAAATVRVVLLALGATLPFLVLAAILGGLGWALYLGGRRVWKNQRPTKPTPAP